MNLYVISGRSGSGKSTLLHALEDAGLNCVDNFPASMLSTLIEKVRSQAKHQDLAVCIDVRNASEDLQALPSVLESVKALPITTHVVYLDAISSVLVKRFSDTRRRHPLDNLDMDLREAIDAEKQVLDHVAQIADLRIDTTQLSTHDLVQLAQERLVGRSDSNISLLFRSFGYKSGVPVDADLTFDARCLPNPHWVPELRNHTGAEAPVREFLDKSDMVNRFFDDICTYLETWLPVFAEQHRVYVTVAVGCTGGKHRSVYLAERLARHFSEQYPDTMVRHREQLVNP